jgi:glycosyltransferase involved in cell wall biosynthesis
MARERIIFLSAKNPFSKKDWSGIPYFMMQALQQEYEVDYITSPSFDGLKKAGYYFGKLTHLLTRRKYIFDYGLIMALFYGRHYSQVLKNKSRYKFIFVPAGLTEIAFLNTPIPIVSFGDCSTVQLFDYYPALNDIASLSKAEVNSIEQRAFNKVTLAFFSSSWASDFVQKHFKTNHVATVPFGSNISKLVEIKDKSITLTACNLLFVGVDWERKGGDVALSILHTLLERKIDARLTVIGCVPPKGNLRHVRVIEKLDKNSAKGEDEFITILNHTDFFILPTHADCTPLVIAEAFSAGVPVLATRTGGISSLVRDGFNGFLFEPNQAQGYVEKITQLMNDPVQYKLISQNCVQSYTTTLNWSRWAEEVKKITATYLN